MVIFRNYLVLFISLFVVAVSYGKVPAGMISGKVLSLDGEAVEYATVFLKGTSISCSTNEKGLYHISAPTGEYTLVFSSVGYERYEVSVKIKSGVRSKLNVKLRSAAQLAEVIVVGNSLSKVKNSAYNATAVNTRDMVNTTKTLSDALNRALGIKIRESGGIGSDMTVTMDGFSGKHVKVFIDGVPQEGVGSSFGLNNIPVNFADRIEVYRGVVPVGFGADAIGGVINIVTPRRQRRWFADSDINFHWHGLGARDNALTVTYDNQFTHSFCYYTENIGSNKNDYVVPDQSG